MSILVGPMFSCELRQHDLRHSLLEEVVEHPSVLRAIVVGEVGLHRQVDREKRSRVRRFGDRELDFGDLAVRRCRSPSQSALFQQQKRRRATDRCTR